MQRAYILEAQADLSQGVQAILWEMLWSGQFVISKMNFTVCRSLLTAPYSSKIDILLSKKGLVN